ncbi:hypothetical protein D3C77_455720 [compost metagenome]
MVPTSNVLVQPLHLTNTQRGLQFSHTVIEAEIDLLVIPGTISLMSHLLRVTGYAVTT